jgi:hypothetical protein
MKNSTWIAIFVLTQIMALFFLFVGNFESKIMHNAIGVVTLINTVGIVWMVLRILKSPQ